MADRLIEVEELADYGLILQMLRYGADYYSLADLQAAPAGDRAYAQSQLTITDDESPYLALSSRVSAVGEGSTVELTVRRYQPTTSAPLTVTLSCADPRVSFSPLPVTIAAGHLTATTMMSIQRNSIEGDDGDIRIAASASGLSSGQLQLHVTDRTLPDAVNPAIECVGTHFYAGLTATVRATIRNYGTSTLPKGMTIDFYLANANRLWYTSSISFFQATTNEDIAVGGEKTFEFEAQLPQVVGSRWVYARLNSDNKIAEFNIGNNLTQTFCPITIEAPFEVETITAAPEDCLPGDIVTVKGRMRVVEGSQLNNQTVRVTLAGIGQSTAAETTINAQGDFQVNVKVDRSAQGYMTVKAVALGQTEPAKSVRVHVYNMSLTGDTRWDVDENIAAKGSLLLRNTSEKPITISRFDTSQPLPDDATISFDTSQLGTLAPGATATIPYTVKGTKPSATRQYFTVTATSQEGLQAQLSIGYQCHATSAYLVFTPQELNTTMLYNADRDNVTVTIRNAGKKATGKITELITKDWVMSDFGDNRELQPGESATIHLRLLAQPDMHVGRVYKNFIQLTPANGTPAGLPISVTTTGDEFATFDLYATDVYTLAKGDYSHVAGAAVTISNARTGATVVSGTIDGQGHWSTSQMREGTYNVTVKASRHKTVTTQVAIGPGENRQTTVLLPYQAFMADFVASHDVATNTYSMKQYFNVDLLAPQAIVLAYIRDEGFGCGEETVELRLVNVGQRPATNISLLMPTVAGCDLTLLNDLPAVMMPGDVHVLKVAYKGPSEGSRRLISAIRLHYAFDARGTALSEDDDYQVLMGCANRLEGPSVPVRVDPQWPDDPDAGDSGTSGTSGTSSSPASGSGGLSGGTALPTYHSFATIEFDEDLSTLRCGQPLHGTLRVSNGQEKALRSLRFEPQVSNEQYDDFTPLFTYAAGVTTTFTADGNYLQLGAGQEGTLRFTLTPQADAAEDGATTYYLGGTLSYIDASTGIHNSAKLPEFLMTVRPVSDVTLTYIIQRNFLADDAETEQVEDTEPVVFSLLARNTGNATLDELQLTTTLPVVVGNATSRQVAYTNHYAAVNGGQGNYTFDDFKVQNLKGGATMAARWIYSTTASAHVDNLQQVANGVTASQASGTTVKIAATRELYRVVRSPRATVAGLPATDDADALEQKIQSLSEGDTYLVDDIEDEQQLPDAVITASGSDAALGIVSTESKLTPGAAAGTYTLTVTTSGGGWKYGRLHDPTNGLMLLQSVTRKSDGRIMSLANFWQSDRTPQADYTMIQERLLHFADSLSTGTEMYDLKFVERPNQPVTLMSIALYTAEGKEVATLDDYEIAAFCGTECRGVAQIVAFEYGGTELKTAILRVRSQQASGEAITFRVYDRYRGRELAVEGLSLPFLSQAVTGLPSSPQQLPIAMLWGDANDDGVVDGRDLRATIDHILGRSKVAWKEATDLNHNGRIDIADATALISLLTH